MLYIFDVDGVGVLFCGFVILGVCDTPLPITMFIN
jgi:hypothetical protein